MAAVRAADAGGRALVLGGARSGKSEFAESLVADEPAVTYLATGTSGGDDPDWRRRIATHRARRPTTWRTVETSELAAALTDAQGAILVDSLTTWLTGAIELSGSWDAPAGTTPAVSDRIDALLRAWHATTARVVAVSDEVGWGVVPPTPAGRLFRDELGALNQRMAAAADSVWLVVAGIPMRLR